MAPVIVLAGTSCGVPDVEYGEAEGGHSGNTVWEDTEVGEATENTPPTVMPLMPVGGEGDEDDTEPCSVPAWDPEQHWTTYEEGDRKANAGKVWECTNIDFSYLEPSGPWGHFGWALVVVNSGTPY